MPEYNESVFVNCPFDEEYAPMLWAIIYTIYRCGFSPITALDEDDGSENRLGKIERHIRNCKYGVHDLSRTELSNGLPRFNMPFELGIFFGAKHFGNKDQKNKSAIIFDVSKYRYQQFISDLNGVDIKAHGMKVETAITQIRNWLRTSSKRTTIPGNVLVINDFNTFSANLPSLVKKLDLDINNISFNDYCYIVEEAIKSTLAK